MKTKLVFAATTIALLLSGCAQQHSARNCDQAVEAAYQFIERALTIRPELAYSPVRNDADDALLWLACRDGKEKGAAHDNTRLIALQDYINEASRQQDMTVEDGRYLVNDMAIYLSHLYGYESAVS